MPKSSSTADFAFLPRCLLWGEQLTRPTTSFARGCKLWSRERQFYEDERRKNMAAFRDRPYLSKQYPEIGKHYPGTWRVVDSGELDDIVFRLTQPTRAHVSRAEQIRERSAYVRSIVDTEKAKDIMYPRRPAPQSAEPRLEGNSNNNTASSSARKSTSESHSTSVSITNTAPSPRGIIISRFRGSRKWDKTAWAHARVRGTSPLFRYG